jgi:hypothetical protein
MQCFVTGIPAACADVSAGADVTAHGLTAAGAQSTEGVAAVPNERTAAASVRIVSGARDGRPAAGDER